VIPYVEKIITKSQNKDIAHPKLCPCCNYLLEMSGEYLICGNSLKCSAQIEGRIQNYLNRLEVKGYGDALVSALVESGVHYPHQVYEVQNIEDMEINGRRVGGLGANAEESLRTSSVDVPLARLLGSLGVYGWGERMFSALLEGLGIKEFKELENKGPFKEGIFGIGPKRLEILNDNYENIINEVSILVNKGYVTISPFESPTSLSGGSLSGNVYLFTGFRDKALEVEIAREGGAIAGSYSKKVTHVISTDPNGGSSKLKKARADGKLIITPELIFSS
jgi:DNA ligase (NAD+)